MLTSLNPFWALSLSSPFTRHLLTLDLSYNPGLEWDIFQWLPLLDALCSLKVLDVRGAGFNEEDMKEFVGCLSSDGSSGLGLPPPPCALTLSCLKLGPPRMSRETLPDEEGSGTRMRDRLLGGRQQQQQDQGQGQGLGGGGGVEGGKEDDPDASSPLPLDYSFGLAVLVLGDAVKGLKNLKVRPISVEW